MKPAPKIDVTQLEINKATAEIRCAEARLSQVREYRSELTENFELLKSKEIRIVVLREFGIVRSIIPKLTAEIQHLTNTIFAKNKEIAELRADLKDINDLPLAKVLEFRRARSKT